jgi:hypothetical protein
MSIEWIMSTKRMAFPVLKSSAGDKWEACVHTATPLSIRKGITLGNAKRGVSRILSRG